MPACRTAVSIGCVVAFSTYDQHLVDANIELGYLITLVHRQAATFAQHTLNPKP